ncbi:MAG: c-type cytochrome [Gammaproteobacteria bacterium]|nr:c-type cytochrome [Gammaproteobacteria bacterium]
MRIPVLLQAVLVIVIAYLVLDNAFPPVLPQTLMIQYMLITVVGVLLYFSFDDERWAEFLSPIQAVLRNDNQWLLRGFFLIAIPVLVGWVTFQIVRPSLDSPIELRQVHPAPPSSLNVFNKKYDLTSLENPIRAEVIEKYPTDKDAAMQVYNDGVLAGRDVYYQNCFYCHGDLLDGTGPFADGFTNPLPINFQDVGTIAQLQEAFLFWRISTGGPGLPKEGTPWNSAMPVWHEFLNENDVWNVITFLYDYVGQVPRIWDQNQSKIASAIKDELVSERASMMGKELYEFRCTVCHGEQGMADGVAAERMYPRPRDFTLGLFKYKTTPGSLPPSDDDLLNTIKHGLTETGMPGWSSLLSDAQIKSLVPVIKGFDIAATWPPEDADDDAFDDDGRYIKDDFISITEREPFEGAIDYTPESLVRGKEVFDKACKECHGAEGRGNITSGKRLEDDWGYRIWPRDLTKAWTYRVSEIENADPVVARSQTIQRIYERLSIGITGTPMPAHRAVEEGNKDPISLDDRWHVSNYVYSLRETAAPVPGESNVLSASKVSSLPTDVNSEQWDQAKPVSFRLVPNIIKGERHFTPLSDSVTVRSVYSKDKIAFLLEVDDRTDSRPGEPVSDGIQDENLTMYSDALAVQFPKQNAFETSPVVVKPLYRHGDKKHETTIWYWNAGSIQPEKKSMSALIDASGPDQKLKFREAGDLNAAGSWTHGKWKVMFTRPRLSSEGNDVIFDEGQFIPVSFANWDGSNGEVGSKHTLTTWYWLVLPPETNWMKVAGIPLGIALFIFLAGLMLVNSQRKLAKQ